jgi:YidC/Oxa1 family membrane protein insertase
VREGTADEVVSPLAALAVEITPPGGSPQAVGIYEDGVWETTGTGAGVVSFRAVITDENDVAVLRIEREYRMSATAPALELRQRLVNLTGSALTVRYFQMGPVDPPQDDAGYGGDKRRVRFGFLLSPEYDATQSVVLSNDLIIPRADVLGKKTAARLPDGRVMTDANGNQVMTWGEVTQWPNKTSAEEGLSLAWVGVSNRYFGAAVYPVIDPGAKAPDKTLRWVREVTRVVLDPGMGSEPVVALRLDSRPMELTAAGTAGAVGDVSLGAYAGPLDKQVIGADPLASSVGVKGLVYYNFGGMCGWCTFASLTDALYTVLHFLHDRVFFDWSLAIVFLVVIVRSILHPVTRWSQIRTARFGKQMQAVAPKQKALQEKYRDDPVKLQQETRKLWADEGISPAGFLGCLPMFLQTPVWIALYATLYFAYELRHEGAFYGVFQAIQGTGSPLWWFLGDLAEPDRLYYFGKTVVTIPLLGPIQSINVLPVLLGVVFFLQQKYLMTPTSTAMTPEQELQMKMMKWMTVFMFPLVMYNAPAGLSIYFIANSTLGILESKWIRSHMESKGLLDLDRMRAERNARRSKAGAPKPTGFMAKLAAIAEEQQKRAGQQRPKR